MEMRIAAESFLEQDEAMRVDVTSNTVFLSQIFKWYREDFGQTNEEVVFAVSFKFSEYVKV